MMRIAILATVLFCHIVTCYARQNQDATKGFLLVKEMFEQAQKVKTLSYSMWKTERHHDKLVVQQSLVKLQRKPFKVYTRQSMPKDGVEALYIEGEHNNHALINPNGFPWMSFHLDPFGSVMRKGQHHIIQRSGFDHVASILMFLFKKYGDETISMTKFDGDTTWRGRDCWVVSFNNPYFKYVDYTIGKGDDLLQIAEKSKLSEHMILEINPQLSDYYSVSEGKKIKIPTDYASKMTLYIDKKLMLPVIMKVFDDKGLYEHYEFRDLIVDPAFTEQDFSADNSQYGF